MHDAGKGGGRRRGRGDVRGCLLTKVRWDGGGCKGDELAAYLTMASSFFSAESASASEVGLHRV